MEPGSFGECFTDCSQCQEQLYTNNKQGKTWSQSKQLIKIHILLPVFTFLALQHRVGKGSRKSLCCWHMALLLSGKTLPGASAAPLCRLPGIITRGMHKTSLGL